jgi:hypothetical protein
MATQTDTEALDKGRLRKLALPGAVAALSAGIGMLLTVKPKRLRSAIAKLPGGAQDFMGDLKERADSMAGTSAPQSGGEGSRKNADELQARRQERKKRRERRRQHATT